MIERRALVNRGALLAAAAIIPSTAYGAPRAAALTTSGDSTVFNVAKLEWQFMANLDLNLHLLESIPLEVQNASYASAADMQKTLEKYIGHAEMLNPTLVRYAAVAADAGQTTLSMPAGTTLFSNPWGCLREVAWFIAQWGVPILKAVQWLRKIRTIFSTWRAIRDGLRNGSIKNMIGPEGYKFIEAFVGFGSAVGACA